MFILYFLGVGPPCPLIFCQFWLCEEAQCVYLRRHLGSPLSILITIVLHSASGILVSSISFNFFLVISLILSLGDIFFPHFNSVY